MTKEIEEWLQILFFIFILVLYIFEKAWSRTRAQIRDAEKQAKNAALKSGLGPCNIVPQYSAATRVAKAAHDYYQTIMNIDPIRKSLYTQKYKEKHFCEIRDYFNATLLDNIEIFPEQSKILEYTKLMRELRYVEIKDDNQKKCTAEYEKLASALTISLQKRLPIAPCINFILQHRSPVLTPIP